MKRFKIKAIRQLKKLFLIRISFYLKNGGSIKIHIIVKDDTGEPHTHPCDFKSFILFGGYYESIYKNFSRDKGDVKLIKWEEKEYRLFDINIKQMDVYHRISLKRLFGIPIPCITIGFYSEKKQLCSLCKPYGRCLQQKDKH